MKPRVDVIPASPPCAAIEAALRLKGVAYDVTELPNVLRVPHQLARLRAPTVPSMKLGDEKLVGSRRIMRRIEGFIDAGTIGTDQPTAADLQIAPILAFILGMEDVARVLAPYERVIALARRWFPGYPGHVPAGVIPADWLPSGTSSSA